MKKKLGVLPEKVVDFKALCGDTSDNIPGVKGIGEKTAVKLLDEYGDLDGIYQHIDEISGRAKSALEGSEDIAHLSQKLSRIVTDLDVKLDLEQARIDRFNPRAVENLFRELEFRTLTDQLNKLVGKMHPVLPQGEEQMDLFPQGEEEAAEEEGTGDIKTGIIDTPEALADLVKVLEKAEMIAFDT